MRIEIVVPQIGEAVAELTLVAWHKRVGDAVEKGDLLFEIDSDKAIVEVEAFAAGRLTEILAADDSSVAPQQVVALMEAAGDAAEPGAGSRHAAAELASVAEPIHSQAQHATPSAVESTAPRPINASPKARRLAWQAGIDLSRIAGSGPDGMISVADVEAALRRKPEPVSAESTPRDRIRRTMATRTQASKQSVPHFYLTADVNMSACHRFRERCRGHRGWQKPPTYTALLLAACAKALANMPAANCSWIDGKAHWREAIHIGIAVYTEAGLLVPVVSDADGQSLQQLAESLGNAIARAQEGRLAGADVGEKSMVISNLGMFGVDQFLAIIDMPDPMILAAGRIADRVVPMDGAVGIQKMCALSLSVDHRVLDGVQGARFLGLVKDCLENPIDCFE